MECPFSFAQCTVRSRRNDLDVHMHANAAEHLALLTTAPAALLVALLGRAATEPVKVAAANALRDLASDIDTMRTVMHEGAIPPLVALTTGSGTDTLKEAALGALRSLALFDINRSRIMNEPRVIENLIALLSWGSDGVEEAAVDVLLILGVGLFRWRMDGAARADGVSREGELAARLSSIITENKSDGSLLLSSASNIPPTTQELLIGTLAFPCGAEESRAAEQRLLAVTGSICKRYTPMKSKTLVWRG